MLGKGTVSDVARHLQLGNTAKGPLWRRFWSLVHSYLHSYIIVHTIPVMLDIHGRKVSPVTEHRLTHREETRTQSATTLKHRVQILNLRPLLHSASVLLLDQEDTYISNVGSLVEDLGHRKMLPCGHRRMLPLGHGKMLQLVHGHRKILPFGHGKMLPLVHWKMVTHHVGWSSFNWWCD